MCDSSWEKSSGEISKIWYSSLRSICESSSGVILRSYQEMEGGYNCKRREGEAKKNAGARFQFLQRQRKEEQQQCGSLRYLLRAISAPNWRGIICMGAQTSTDVLPYISLIPVFGYLLPGTSTHCLQSSPSCGWHKTRTSIVRRPVDSSLTVTRGRLGHHLFFISLFISFSIFIFIFNLNLFEY